MKAIRQIDLATVDPTSFLKHLADCVVLSVDGRIVLQKRPANWGRHAGVVNLFGGHVEMGEAVVECLIRELHEELGARVAERDLVFVGAVTEDWTNHTEVVHVYFWHDKANTITGCYECEAISFPTLQEALQQPTLMDYARWALEQCRERGLIRSCSKQE